MGKGSTGESSPRRVWRVDYPNGEVVWLNKLAHVRRSMDGDYAGARPATLKRLERGRYYFVDTWTTGAGVVAGVVMVTRQRARAARLERNEQPLPFEPVETLDRQGVTDHGV